MEDVGQNLIRYAKLSNVIRTFSQLRKIAFVVAFFIDTKQIVF